jgi:hypothetical protein
MTYVGVNVISHHVLVVRLVLDMLVRILRGEHWGPSTQRGRAALLRARYAGNIRLAVGRRVGNRLGNPTGVALRSVPVAVGRHPTRHSTAPDGPGRSEAIGGRWHRAVRPPLADSRERELIGGRNEAEKESSQACFSN